jgi:hypothetical protein
VVNGRQPKQIPNERQPQLFGKWKTISIFWQKDNKLNVDQDDSNNIGDKAQNDENVDQISPNKVHESEPSENKPIFPPDPKEVISKATDNVLEMNAEVFGNLLNNIIEDYNLKKKDRIMWIFQYSVIFNSLS